MTLAELNSDLWAVEGWLWKTVPALGRWLCITRRKNLLFEVFYTPGGI